MARCIALGKALYKAVLDWPGDERVAIIASGGLSHFVCDESFDRRILQYLVDYDFAALAAVDDRSYQAGTSEIKLYATMMLSMQAIGARMTLIDYIPCYRSNAGTGEGMGFMHWTTQTENRVS
jgi:3-O-methylgallate 3,4-dioxygenase